MALTPEELDSYIKARIETHVAEMLGQFMGQVDEKLRLLEYHLSEFLLQTDLTATPNRIGQTYTELYNSFILEEYRRLHPAPVKNVTGAVTPDANRVSD